MPYTIESSGQLVGTRVDDLSATLWGPGYEFLLLAMWTGNNTLLRMYDLGEGAVFNVEQTLDPTQYGNDVAVAAPVSNRAVLGYKKLPGGTTCYLTWKQGSAAIDDSTEAAYQDHSLELSAFHEPAHPLYRGGQLPEAYTIVTTAGATVSPKPVHAAAVSITSLHKMRLAIWHFDGGGELKVKLGSYPEDVSEPATRVHVVTTAEYLVDGLLKAGDLLTAVRYNNQLKLIRWRYDRRPSPDTLQKIGQVTLDEQVDECGLTTITTTEGVVAVTALRLTSGNLKLIGWKLQSNGSLTRWLETTSREIVSSVTCANVRNSDVVTCVKMEPGGQMRLIYWYFPFNANPAGAIQRRVAVDGDVVSWVKCLHQPGKMESYPGYTITMSRLPDTKLKLRRWKVKNT